MDEKTEEPKADKKRGKLDVSAVLTAVAYPISGAAGYYAAKQNIRKDSVEWHTKLGTFDSSTAKMMSQAKDASAKGGGEFGSNMQEAMANIRGKYEAAKSRKFQKMGYRSIRHNWNDLADNSKMEAITVGFTAAFISLGALLMIANSKDIFKPLFKDDSEQDKKQKPAAYLR